MPSRLGVFLISLYIQLQTIVQNGALIEDLENDPNLLSQYSEERIINFTQYQTTAVLKCPVSAGLFKTDPPALPDGTTERRREQLTTESSRICEPKRIWRSLSLALSINGSLIQIVQVCINSRVER